MFFCRVGLYSPETFCNIFLLMPNILQCVFNYLLTPWSTELLQKLNGSYLIKKFSAFYGTRMFITTFTNARHLSLPEPDQSSPCPHYTTSRKYILILSSHLKLGLPSCLFPLRFPNKTLYRPLLFLICGVYAVKKIAERSSPSKSEIKFPDAEDVKLKATTQN